MEEDGEVQESTPTKTVVTQPETDFVTIWKTDGYDDAERKIDIVAVHGLFGTSAIWTNAEKVVSWLQSAATAKKLEARVIGYTWAISDKPNEACSRRDIAAIAEKLLTWVKRTRSEKGEKIPLAFASHDIGGIIVKEALVLASQRGNQFSGINYATRFLLFFACPHRWKQIADLESSLAHFLFAGGQGNNKALRNARRLVDAVAAINGSFFHTRALLRANTLNVFSVPADDSDSIFGAYIPSLGIPNEVDYSRDDAQNELPTKAVEWDFPAKLGPALERLVSFPWMDDDVSTFVDIIQSQAPPFYPLDCPVVGDSEFSWLDENAAYKKLIEECGPAILYLYGASPTVSSIAQYAFQKFEDRQIDELNLYFKFDSHDANRNSIGAMANTFLAHLLNWRRKSPADLIGTFQPPAFGNCWTAQDAWLFLEWIKTEMGSVGRVRWTLDSIDQCDETKEWFLSALLYTAANSEKFWKVVITGTPDEDLRKRLSQFHIIDADAILDQRDVRDKAPEEVADIIARLPALQYFEEELLRLLRGCGKDLALRDLVLGLLRSGTRLFTSSDRIRKTLESLSPPSPRSVCENVLRHITKDRRPWARLVLTWVLRSSRPLGVVELASALAISDSPTDAMFEPATLECIALEVRECFGPLLAVENGEIRLAQAIPRDLFILESTAAASDQSRPWYSLDASEVDHRRIVDTCLSFLAYKSRGTVRNGTTENGSAESTETRPDISSHFDFLSYCVEFWPRHLKLAYLSGTEAPPTAKLTEFLRNEDTLQYWARESWQISNPYNRPEQPLTHPLSIFAALGLQKLIRQMTDSQGSVKENEGAAAAAVTEASRHGHREIVQNLLKASTLSQADLSGAIDVAAKAGEFGTLRDLVDHTKSRHPKFDWSPFVVARVAWLGPQDLLEILLASGAPASPDDSPDYPAPLLCAAARNRFSAVSSLLKHGADCNAKSVRWLGSTPLHVAAKMGYWEVLEVLIQKGADKEAHDQDEHTALWWASLHGHHSANKTLLEAGAEAQSAKAMVVPAARQAFLKTMKELLAKGVDPNLSDTAFNPPTPLGTAARKGHVDAVQSLLEAGADVNGTETDRPVVKAAMYGSLDIVKLLVKSGADVNKIQKGYDDHTSALIVAADNGNVDMIKYLLEVGADKNVGSVEYGKTPLYFAARSGKVEALRVLGAAGADLEKVTPTQKWTPLHVSYDEPESARTLLELGANVNAESLDGTAAYLATYHKELKVLQVVLEKSPDLELRCSDQGFWDDGYTPLLAAAKFGRADLCRLLLEAGADVNAKSSFNSAVLHLAVVSEDAETVRTVLEYHPDFTIQNNEKDMPLHLIQVSTPLSMVQMLVNVGADIDVRGNWGYTPLGRAVLRGNMDVVKYLLRKGAEINLVGGYWAGPIHLACRCRRFEILKFLVSKGANVNLADQGFNGTPLIAMILNTPADDEAAEEQMKFVKYLVEEAKADVNAYGGFWGSFLHAASISASLKMIRYAMDQGADTNYRDPIGRQAIHNASFRTVEIVQYILEKGGDLTARDKTGRTPLHIAVTSGRPDLVKFVLAKTPQFINEPDRDGWTPLLYAMRPCKEWDTEDNPLEITKLLLAAGADIWVRGMGRDEQWSAFKLAKYHDLDAEVIKLVSPPETKRPAGQAKDETWDAQFHITRKGKYSRGVCDVCFTGVFGPVTACKQCINPFWLCFKCARWKDEYHPEHKEFELKGEDVEDEEEEDNKGEATESQDSSSGRVEQIQDDDEAGDWSDDDASKDAAPEAAGEEEANNAAEDDREG